MSQQAGVCSINFFFNIEAVRKVQKMPLCLTGNIYQFCCLGEGPIRSSLMSEENYAALGGITRNFEIGANTSNMKEPAVRLTDNLNCGIRIGVYLKSRNFCRYQFS